jgi:hypothetical protein
MNKDQIIGHLSTVSDLLDGIATGKTALADIQPDAMALSDKLSEVVQAISDNLVDKTTSSEETQDGNADRSSSS